jgi:hypothetical protein
LSGGLSFGLSGGLSFLLGFFLLLLNIGNLLQKIID